MTNRLESLPGSQSTVWICRSVEIGDAAAVARVHVDAWRAAYAELMPADYLSSLDPDVFRTRWEQGLHAGRTSTLIECDGRVVGFAMYGASRDADAAPSTGELFAINLDPSQWRMGLGRALLAVSVSRLREAGFIDATLWVLHGNERARRFYEALGWQADGAEKRERIAAEVEVHEVRYRRALDDADGTCLDAVRSPHRAGASSIEGPGLGIDVGHGQTSAGDLPVPPVVAPQRAVPAGAERDAGDSSLVIAEESLDRLEDYERIPIAFEVRRIFEVQSLGSGPLLLERPVAVPWKKDYDAIDGERPSQWAARFDLSRWGMITARRGGRLVGGAVLASSTPGVEMLEDRDDLVVLWDIRVLPDERRNGVGALLFRASMKWARARGCTQLKVETQNINLGACRFYARQGCVLRQVHRFAYPTLPDEVQLIWYRDLQENA